MSDTRFSRRRIGTKNILNYKFMEKGPKNPDSEKEGKINRRDFLKTIAKVTGVAAAAGASAVAMEKRAEKQNPEFKIEELLKMIKENEKKLVTAEYDIPGEIDPSEIKFYKGKQDKLVEMQTKLREKYAEIEDLEKQ